MFGSWSKMSVFVWKESIAILFHNLNISFNLPCNWFVCCLPSDEMNRIVNCREYIVQLEQQQEMLRRQVRGNSVEKYLNVFSSDWAPMLLSRTRRWTWCRAASATSGTCPSTSPTSWTSRQCKAASLWHKEWYRDVCYHRMLDEFGTEIEHADSRLDATMKKMAKVLRLSDGESH